MQLKCIKITYATETVSLLNPIAVTRCRFPYGLTVAIFGGTVEYIALWLRSINLESLFFYYVAFSSLISLIVYWGMLETSKHSTIESHNSVESPEP